MIFTAIGTAIAGALFAGSTIAATVIAGGLAFGASLLVSSLMRKSTTRAASQPYSAVQGQVQYGASVPATAVFGPGKLKGHHIFYAKWGSGNKFNADVFVLANGWCDGLEPEVFFYGAKHALVARAIIGNEVEHYGVSGYGDLVSIRFYDGRPGQGPDTKLVSDTAGLGNTWKSTSVCAGMTYVVVERQWDEALFDKGRPDFEFVLRGLREYDPRKDSTVAGGDGLHRIDDPSTWEFSENPVLHRLNYQLGLRGMASGRVLIGEGKSLGQLDLGSYFAAMNVADTLREGKPTYQAALIVTADDDHTEVLKEFDDAIAGYALNRRGLSGVIAGAPQIPVLEITAADIPVDRPQQIQRRKSAFELFNYMSGQFTSKEKLWSPESLNPVTVNLDVAADGRPRQVANDFLQVTDPDIAQYLLNIRYRQNRKGGSATLPVSRRVGLKVQEGEWVDFDGKEWLITGWRCDIRFRITLTLAETGADVYSEEGIEPGPIVVPSTPPVNPSLLSTVQDFSVQVGIISASDDQEVPALQFTWEPPADPTITAVRFFYFVGTDPAGQTVYQDQTTEVETGSFVTSKDVVPGVHYTARATITTVPDRFKSFTPWVTTDTVTGPFGLAVYGDIDLDALSAQSQGFFGWMGMGLRDLLEQSQALALLAGDQELANAAQFDEMRRSLSLVAGDLSASFEETITVAIVPMQGQLVAIADSLTELSAGDGADVTTARFRMTVQTGEAGGVTIGAQGRTGTEGDWRDAGYFLYVPNDEEELSSFTVVADQFVITSEIGAAAFQPFIFESGNLRVVNAYIANLTAANIQAGSITADRLNVTTLSAVSANLGTVTAGTVSLGGGQLLIDGANVRILVSD